jgi:single-strand DNA-binding protein
VSRVNEIYVTVAGRLVAAPEARNTRTGVPFASFRLASTVRRPNPSNGQYEDAATSFVNVTAFRSLGANVANSLKKGDPVVVYGRMRVNQWMRSDNTPATSVEIDAYNIGHDLTWGTTAFQKVTRAQVDGGDRLADPAIQSVHAGFEGYDPSSDPYDVHGDVDEGPGSSGTPAKSAGSDLSEQDEQQLSAV